MLLDDEDDEPLVIDDEVDEDDILVELATWMIITSMYFHDVDELVDAELIIAATE